jgi:hypothetical protein
VGEKAKLTIVEEVDTIEELHELSLTALEEARI